MKGFQYPFQKVLDLKTNTKKQAEWMLSQAIGELQAEEDSLSRVKKERHDATITLQELVNACAPVHELQMWQHHILHLDEKLIVHYQRVKQAEGVVSTKQSALHQCMSDEKLWVKAREKAEQQFKLQVSLMEQNELDEMATVRYFMASR
ncbi:flagellar export protein FliJ [Paenibacillus assamensis]|uniref:flagellar export protein FliJ n=1 Tax=Paenibacillus assamensis TaxID=311244 RepID=UPI00041A8C3B|nr:flagellar export protein FliJ [Paenibacillus assamensis]